MKIIPLIVTLQDRKRGVSHSAVPKLAYRPPFNGLAPRFNSCAARGGAAFLAVEGRGGGCNRHHRRCPSVLHHQQWNSSSTLAPATERGCCLPGFSLLWPDLGSPSGPPRGFHNQEVALHARGTNKIRFFYTLQEPDQHPGRCNLVSGGMNDIVV